MKRLSIISLFIFLAYAHAFSQKLKYDIPKEYRKDVSKSDYKTIADQAISIISNRYKIDYLQDGTIELEKGQELQTINLHNLVGKCLAAKDKSAWRSIIEEHFNNMFSSFDEQKKINPADFETIKKYLSLRIYPLEIIAQRGGTENLVTKKHLEGTLTLLMLDLPGAFTTVQREHFKLWKTDTANVFSIAQTNINQQEMEKVIKTFDLDSAQVEVIFIGNEDYAASYALDLANNSPDLVGEWGSVVAIPNKGLVDVCKISKDKPVEFVKFIQMTKPLIEQAYQEHEQPVSPDYYWYYQGKFTRIKILTGKDGNINVMGAFKIVAVKKVKFGEPNQIYHDRVCLYGFSAKALCRITSLEQDQKFL